MGLVRSFDQLPRSPLRCRVQHLSAASSGPVGIREAAVLDGEPALLLNAHATPRTIPGTTFRWCCSKARRCSGRPAPPTQDRFEGNRHVAPRLVLDRVGDPARHFRLWEDGCPILSAAHSSRTRYPIASPGYSCSFFRCVRKSARVARARPHASGTITNVSCAMSSMRTLVRLRS